EHQDAGEDAPGLARPVIEIALPRAIRALAEAPRELRVEARIGVEPYFRARNGRFGARERITEPEADDLVRAGVEGRRHGSNTRRPERGGTICRWHQPGVAAGCSSHNPIASSTWRFAMHHASSLPSGSSRSIASQVTC